jgi:phospholipase/carboxylesterase
MGRQWYNLQPIDWSELPAARKALRTRLIALGCSVPLKRTVLLGFSQGGAMAVDVGGELQLAGIVACSGYPHQGWRPAAEAQPTPVLLSHGLQDPVVPYAASESLKKQLLQAGRPVKLLPFSGQHGIGETVLPEIAAFVRQCLN